MSLEHPTESEDQLGDQFTSPDEPESTPVKTGTVAPWFKPVALVAMLATVAIYVLRLDKVVGLAIDDAWYVLLAKGLATGQGYTVANSPTPGILPLYPPGFPFLLSLIYRCAPNFPQNVWLLKLLSVFAMWATGWLVYRYFIVARQVGPVYALLLALATVLCPPLVFLATSTLMSECVFTFFLMATIVLTERLARDGQLWQRGKGQAIAAILGCAALASSAFFIRTIAVALLGAVFLYLLFARQVRAAVLYAIFVAVMLSPWLVYSRLHAPTYEQGREQGGQIVMSYSVQFWQRMAAMTTAQVMLADIPWRVGNNLLEVSGRDVLHILAAPVFEMVRDPYQEAKALLEKNAAGEVSDEIESPLGFSLFLSAFVLLGFAVAVRERFTCAELVVPFLLFLIVLWPWETIRFVLPLSPFLFFYWATGIKTVFTLIRRNASAALISAVPLAAIALSLLINVSGHINYLSKKMNGVPTQWERTFADVETMLQWTKQNIPAAETVVALNPPLVNLYTGHKTIAWEQPKIKWHLWRAAGIRHFVRFGAYAIPEEPELGNYPVVYHGKEFQMKVIDLGTTESRLPWGAAPPAR